MAESIFITGYSKDNVQASKQQGILGWKHNSKRKELVNGDYVFVYDIDNKKIDSLFQINSRIQNNDLLWKDEIESKTSIYKNRWKANLIQDNLNIQIKEILSIYPFNTDPNRFYLFIKNNFPNFLDEKYSEFRSFLLTKSKVPNLVTSNEKFETNNNEINSIQYFLVQVTKDGSLNILTNKRYQNSDWKSKSRNHDHGKVKKGDILLVYFAGNSIQYTHQLKKIYNVDSVSSDNVTFYLKEIKDLEGIFLKKIRSAIETGRLSRTFERIGMQGFNIKQITESEYTSVLTLEHETFDNSNILKQQSNTWRVREEDEGEKQIETKIIEEFDLEKVILLFDSNIDYEREKQIRKQGLDFISLFPRDRISEIDIDEYIIGKPNPLTGNANKSTFCYHLENGLVASFGGIGGQPADKYGIYYNKNNNRYVYNTVNFPNYNEAFKAIRKEIKLILDIGQTFHLYKNWKEFSNSLSNQKFNLKRHVIAKILSVYYPDDFIQIYSDSIISYISEIFGLSKYELPINFFLKQQKLLELKNKHLVMQKWSNLIFSQFLWDLYSKENIKINNISRNHIIKAIERLDLKNIPNERKSHSYYLEYNTNYYPPKYIVCVANKYANGKELESWQLGSRIARTLLRNLGFNIVKGIDEDKEQEQDDEEEIGYKIHEKIRIADIDLDQFIKNTDFDSLTEFNTHRIKDIQKTTIQEIINECSRGRWVLPNFQRYFDWSAKDIKQFFESIFHDYYVGSLLFWKVDKVAELDIIPISGVDIEKKELDPEIIILDGQQRITSLYYALRTPPDVYLKGSKIQLYFYLNFLQLLRFDSEDIIEVLSRKLNLQESFQKMLFPFYELENYREWIKEYDKYLRSVSNESNKIYKIRDILDSRLNHIKEKFEIPFITLPSTMDVSQVTDIFERINTLGKALDVFDLLIARLNKYNVDLKGLWENSISQFSKLKVYDYRLNKMAVYILQSISLYYNKTNSCKRKDLLNIYPNIFANNERLNFDLIWNEMSKYTYEAIKKLENLRDGFGVRTENDLPFAPMIPILSSLIKLIEDQKNKAKCYDKLKTWYWSSIFSNAYSGAVDTQLTVDFKEIKEWFNDDSKIVKTVSKIKKEIHTLDLKQSHSKSSAIYKGILSLIALEGAKDFDTKRNFENANANDKDHLFPKSEFGSHRYTDSILNITWMSDETNRKIKGYKRPSEYVKQFIKEKYDGNEKEFLDILRSHFIDNVAYQCMLNDNFEGFINAREKIIFSKISELIGIRSEELNVEGIITPDRPYSNKMMISNTIQLCKHYIYWVDKYFSRAGLKLLYQFLNKDNVKHIKILTSKIKVDYDLRDEFKDFKKEMDNLGIISEMRVMVDNKLASTIHDRWIISNDICFNVPSVDVIERGQYSEIKISDNKPPFDIWWSKSLDIISDWNNIQSI